MKRLVKQAALFGFLFLASGAFAQNQNDLGLRLPAGNFIRQPFWLCQTMANEDLSNYTVQWQKTPFRTEFLVFHPRSLVKTSGWNVYLLLGEIRQPITNKLALTLNGQVYNSFFRHKTVNWGFGPAVELAFGPRQKIYLLPSLGRFEGQPCKTISLGLQVGF